MGAFRAILQEQPSLFECAAGCHADCLVYFAAWRNQPGLWVLGRWKNLAGALLPRPARSWRFKTKCSDAANRGLRDQEGEFTCTAAANTSRFSQHGPVRVARDLRHFEHADGTPFFWLADTVWDGARLAASRDWDFYARARSSQQFTVAQWTVAPGHDAKKQTAFKGNDHIIINPEFFQRLDAKLDTLSRAGILSAVAPLSEPAAQSDMAQELPADQVALLLRYMVARWGAQPVVWLLALDGGHSAGKSDGWKKIGRAVFAEGPHAPVMLYAGNRHDLLDEFRDQKWIDAFGYDSLPGLEDESGKQTSAGSFNNEWQREPVRPLIPFAPYENGIVAKTNKRFSSDDARHAIYWSLLQNPPAGISYGGEGVQNWDETLDLEGNDRRATELPGWHKALFMPAAKQMRYVAKLMASLDFRRLQPQPDFIAPEPGGSAARRNIAAVGTEARDLSVVYVLENRTLEVFLTALPPSPSVAWFNPRNGQSSPAVAVVGGRTCQFPTPEPGDWVLVMKSAK